MVEGVSVRSLVERLANIAADCFDHRAAKRLRELADELNDSTRSDNPPKDSGADAGGHAAPG